MPATIYLDHHATTPCDPRVARRWQAAAVDAFGNSGSPHAVGLRAREAIEEARHNIAGLLNGGPEAFLFTSGATESNALAIRGICEHPRQKRRKVVSVATEHAAVLEPLGRLQKQGFDVHLLPVHPQGDPRCGQVIASELERVVDDQTALVSVMWANNEIGTLQPLVSIAEHCHRVGAVLHSDATQAVGRVPVDLQSVPVDLLSASAHKFYGPPGVGFLFVRPAGIPGRPRVRVFPQIEGGGQQQGLRAGTLNAPGIVAMGLALQIASESMAEDTVHCRRLRDLLWQRLSAGIGGLQANGPEAAEDRLPGTLNVLFPGVEGEALLSATPEVACSSGAACSSVDPAPSHVLQAIGRSEADARASLRFGIGRNNTDEEIEAAAAALIASYGRLRKQFA